MSCGARLAPFDISELREITSYDELELDTIEDSYSLKKIHAFVDFLHANDGTGMHTNVIKSQI